jgi:integrase
MAKGINRLSGVDLRRNRAGLFGDGGGLWLQVTPAKDGKGFSRSWIFRWARGAQTRSMGLGSLITVTLSEARERARQCRLMVLDGIDPIEARAAERAAKAAANAKSMTFEQCANAFLAAHRQEWRSEQHAKEWPTSLRKHILPSLGKIDVAAIDTAIVVKALQPIWGRIPESASRLRGRIEAILDWAAVSGFRAGDNPARWSGHLEHLLATPSKRKIEHLAAMPWRDLPEFMATLRTTDTVAARAMEFTILTTARRGETRFATWNEMDFDSATWTIPGERMKAGREHRVPLSARAVEILRSMSTVRTGDVIFPGRDGPLGESAFEHLLKRLERRDITLHGFRSSFRTWCSEQTAFAHEVAEQALAHTVGSAVERAYKRTDLFDRRRKLMEAWADFLAQPTPAGATVTPLRAHAGA